MFFYLPVHITKRYQNELISYVKPTTYRKYIKTYVDISFFSAKLIIIPFIMLFTESEKNCTLYRHDEIQILRYDCFEKFRIRISNLKTFKK